ncbi:condensation domain-containing protein [Microbispora sp. KK1-11]|uniref:condensation domain-containing protein n=1 Tax=Microbispora sp. KK1-11 TaxID=2053005 RepID=UPI001158B78D|nr:condensation domain-containing protein [Microbispora sp. KK1-11]TQS25872.1 AMP-binding protein [Microbispora sp. KK1-11]
MSATHDGSEIWRLFADRAAAHPDAPAVSDGTTSLTYGQLAARASAVSDRLPGGLTGVCLPRSVDLVVAMLAALRRGGYLPLDAATETPAGNEVAERFGASAVIAPARVPSAGGVPEIEITYRGARGDTGAGACGRWDTAYVLRTSGSTGEPKGVLVEHGPLAEHLRTFGRRVEVTAEDRMLFFASPVTDVSVEQMLVPLIHGAFLFVRDPGLPDTPADFFATVAAERLTVVNVPAGYWRLLVREAATLPACPDLRLVIAGSDVMPAEAAREWLAGPLRPVRLLNAYGPTEAIITATAERVESVPEGAASAAIGTPLAGRSMYVLDDRLRQVAPGEVGEVYLAGRLARGYAGDPRRTAEVFLPDLFGSGGRMYRTGDEARAHADGSVEFLGRIDRQVKVRGFRVEPAAVEAAARSEPGVADCAAIPDRGADGETRLILLAVGEEGLDTGRLADRLHAVLPGAAAPAAVVRVDRLPLTEGGKVDHRAALALARDAHRSTAPGDDAPGEEAEGLEGALLAIWREAFGGVQVGLDDEFVAIGGDSMTSLAIACQAPAIGVRLRPRDIFEAGTVRKLARRLSAGAERPEAVTPRRSGDEATPATLWLADRLGTVPGEWNQYVLADLASGAEEPSLRAAFAHVLACHPVLTAELVRDGDTWRHRPAAPAPLPWHVVEVADEDEVADLIGRISAGIDPRQGRMIAAAWVRGPHERGRLLMVAHHAVTDAVGWRLLMGEIEAAHRLTADGWGLPAAEPRPGPGQWSATLRSVAAEGRFDQALSHWTQTVAAANAVQRGDHPGTEGTARALTLTVDASVLLAHPYAGLAELVLAAALKTWRTHTGRERCVVELENTGRDELDASAAFEVVGWLTALYPAVVDVREDAAATLWAARRALREVPGRGLGYGVLRHYHPDPQVRESLRLRRSPDLAFNFLGRLEVPDGTALYAPGSRIAAGPRRAAQAVRPCHWVVEAALDGENLTITIEIPGTVTDAAAGAVVAGLGAELAALTHEDAGLPLTPAQEGILFHAAADTRRDGYVGQFAVELTGALDVARAEAAWQEVAAATPSLRSSFDWRRREQPVQRVSRQAGIPVTTHDWSGLGMPAGEAAERLLAAERAPFDLERPPLLRVAFARLGQDRHLCVVTHHHLILDGWSMNLALRDFCAAYEGRPLGRRPLPVTGEGASRPDDGFWRETLAAGAGAPLVPQDRVRSLIQAEATRLVRPEEWRRAAAEARAGGLTPALLLHLAWALTLGTLLDVEEVTFGTVLSGRSEGVEDVEQASGMLINTLPFRVRLDRDLPLDAWQAEASEVFAGVQERQHDSLVVIRRTAGLTPRDLLFDHILDFGTGATMLGLSGEIGFGGLVGVPLRSVERTNYGVTVTAYANEGLELAVNHDTGLLSPEEAETALAILESHVIRLAHARGQGTVGTRLKEAAR